MKTMIGDGESEAQQTVAKNMIVVVFATALILLVPALAMQFTDEMAWGPGDFAIAGALLVGTGFLYVLSRKVSNKLHRAVIGVALAAALLLVWAELAVGIFH